MNRNGPKYTVRELSEQTGISKSLVSRLLRGESEWTLDQLLEMSAALEIGSLGELLIELEEYVKNGERSTVNVTSNIINFPKIDTTPTDDKDEPVWNPEMENQLAAHKHGPAFEGSLTEYGVAVDELGEENQDHGDYYE